MQFPNRIIKQNEKDLNIVKVIHRKQFIDGSGKDRSVTGWSYGKAARK